MIKVISVAYLFEQALVDWQFEPSLFTVRLVILRETDWFFSLAGLAFLGLAF